MKYSAVLLALYLNVFGMTSQAQIFNKIKDWHYLPFREEFWTEFQTQLGKEDLADAVSTVVDVFSSDAVDSEMNEAKVALAQLCLKLGQPGCAYTMAIEVIKDAPTTMQAQLALVIIQDLVELYSIDEGEFTRIINTAIFSQVPPEVESMVNYYVVMDNMTKGLQKWVPQAMDKIDPKSYWGLRIQFFNTINLINSQQIDKAIEQLTLLQVETEKFPKLQSQVVLQKARLLFELRKFDEAEQIYQKFPITGREYGRTLLERSWIRYYQRDYSTTLGLLESLKAPYFQVAVNPEQYILAMVAYRDLCHYPSVKEVSQDFQEAFGPTIENLKKRKPFYQDPSLMRIVLQQSDVQPLADLVSELYVERNKPHKLLESKFSKLGNLWSSMQIYEEGVRGRLNYLLKDRLKVAAESLLDYAEQVKLIDYVSGLDEFRLRQAFEQRSYRPEEIEYFAIDKLYWPVRKEFWWEEMSNYQVRITDRCGGK